MIPFFPFSLRVVSGHSMQPHIKEGERVVVFNWAYLFSKPGLGDIVVFRGKDGREYVKRVKAVADNGLVVEGDNKNDSRQMPIVARSSVIGRVIANLVNYQTFCEIR